MANTNAPFGFIPVRHLSSAPYSGAMANAYYVAAGDSTATFIYDLVVVAATATANTAALTQVSQNGGAIGTFQSIRQGAATPTAGTILGSIVGFETNRSDLTKQYRPASTGDRVVYVADDPDLVFRARETGTLGAASAGLNADIYVGSGSTVSGKSAMAINSTGAVTTALPIRLLQGAMIPDNDVSSAYAVWEVMIAPLYHFYRNYAGIA